LTTEIEPSPRTFEGSVLASRLLRSKKDPKGERTMSRTIKTRPTKPQGVQQLTAAGWAQIVKAIRDLTSPRPV
jgi:hypothetical protein